MEEAGIQVDVIEDKAPFQEAVASCVEEYKEKDPTIKTFIEMANGL